jgi:aerobic-type carbon monoxide dehydrogenase small subunit (CoxS/CutS family)
MAGQIVKFRENPRVAEYSLHINGKLHRVTADPDTPLLWVLRDNLGLTGTKYGCGAGVCGACTVHENGNSVRSCQIHVADASGKNFTTIEGLSADVRHPCQLAWLEEDVSQCGFCQPGMIMEAAALIRQLHHPTDSQIDQAMSQHVCRCGTYQRIRKAIHKAAEGKS